MAKQISYDTSAREHIKNGVQKLARTVKITLGPRGRNVIIEKSFGSPTVTKDGVSVSKEIDLEDPYENMGAQLVKQVASQTNDQARADEVFDAIKVRMEKLVVGPGDDPASEMGPLITAEHRDRVAGYVESGAAQGATVVVDGRDQVFDNDGFFLGVSLLDRVTTDMAVYRDEVFGPVLSVVRVDTYEEGVRMIADNPYGNGAAIFTRDGGAARRFQQDAEAGMVGINVPIPVPVGYHSFGGWNDSFFGDTTMYGPEGIRFYTRPKVITSRWPDPSTSSVDLGFPRND